MEKKGSEAELRSDGYDKVKGILPLGFMDFIDRNRPDGKMCLSNGECADIDRAFDEQDWNKLFRYAEKYGK